MFKTDQKRCQEFAADSLYGFFNTAMFVSITIREKTYRLEQLMLAFQKGGDTPASLYGYKWKTLRYMEYYGKELWEIYKDYWLSKRWLARPEKERATLVMYELLKIPGLGIAKAGLLATLLIGESWCADTHNLVRYGVSYDQYKVTPTTAFTRRMTRIDAYLNLGLQLGGTGRIWNNWCAQISRLYPKAFPTKHEVSSLHWRVHDTMPF